MTVRFFDTYDSLQNALDECFRSDVDEKCTARFRRMSYVLRWYDVSPFQQLKYVYKVRSSPTRTYFHSLPAVRFQICPAKVKPTFEDHG